MPARKRVTQKAIAEALGLTPASVSLALRNHPSIPPATRDNVRAKANELGYAPDPEIARLMSYLRTPGEARHGAHIGILNLFGERQIRFTEDAPRRLMKGLVARAESLGYGIEEFLLGSEGQTPRRLAEILRTRNIEGLILPGARYWRQQLDFPFEDFCVATLGYSVATPMHRACPNSYGEMLHVLAELAARGYRRPGLMITAEADRRMMHKYAAAYLLYQQNMPPGQRLPVLLRPEVTGANFLAWREQHQPDAVIVAGVAMPTVLGWVERAKLGVPDDLGVVHLDLPEADHGYTGIRQNYRELANLAIDLVVAQLHRRERGLPTHPRLLQVDGEWQPGETIRHR